LPELILASQSPRRRELLTVAGFRFSVREKPVEEVRGPREDPVTYVRRLARAKAEAAWERPGEIILGADTTVAIDDHVLEKPSDTNDASAMLRLLSGRDHTVITGICLLHDRGVVVDHSSTLVRFSPLTDSEIADYVASGEPMDKAGAYAIQGLASKFVEKVDGCYFNVMGLPLSLVYRHWKTLTAPK
jgi:septum formation protein